MSDMPIHFLNPDARSEWVRLRTLISLRWLAIIGQSVVVLVAWQVLQLRIPVVLCFAAIGASVLVNIASTLMYPENKRLTDRESMFTLLFDLGQLVLLLFLTGGLNNPFALLILAPVTISATALRLRSTLILSFSAIFLISLVAAYNVPLQSFDGSINRLPPIFIVGFWGALIIGITFLGGYARRVTVEAHNMNQALLATQMALDREQKLTDLGGVVAAAAHELGTPLATIKLVSTELCEELEDGSDLKADAQLIREQADRCRDIMRNMGRAGKDDKHLKLIQLSELVHLAAEPHQSRGKDLVFTFVDDEGGESPEPTMTRNPEVVHGLRNLIQNAVDFSRQNVWIQVDWSPSEIHVRVADDGKGYPPGVLGKLGDPFLRRGRKSETAAVRPEYEGMGLGLFIAKTLLERSGAKIEFANGFEQEDTKNTLISGAVVDVTWPTSRLSVDPRLLVAPLGENTNF
jgi:two-component system sensor histidine kinase RegB